jgi:hypothetical protein
MSRKYVASRRRLTSTATGGRGASLAVMAKKTDAALNGTVLADAGDDGLTWESFPDDSLAGCGGAGGIWQGVKPRIATARGPIPNRHHLHQRGRLRLDRGYNAQGLGGWGSPGHIVDPCSALDFAGCCGANFRIEHRSSISPCASFAPASATPAAVRAGWAPVRGGDPSLKEEGLVWAFQRSQGGEARWGGSPAAVESTL